MFEIFEVKNTIISRVGLSKLALNILTHAKSYKLLHTN